ncbi:MAG: PilZ domain-containing protein [Candidatus Methylomirabilales bacterium]
MRYRVLFVTLPPRVTARALRPLPISPGCASGLWHLSRLRTAREEAPHQEAQQGQQAGQDEADRRPLPPSSRAEKERGPGDAPRPPNLPWWSKRHSVKNQLGLFAFFSNRCGSNPRSQTLGHSPSPCPELPLLRAPRGPLAPRALAAYRPASHARALHPPRRFPRVKVLGIVTGEVSFLQDVTLLDLSEGGARLEHAGRFALHAICFLRLPGPEGELVLKARGVPSAVSRTGSGEGATLLYQSGIEFFALTSETLAALRKLLADLPDAAASP